MATRSEMDTSKRAESAPANGGGDSAGGLDALFEAIESGAGLPAVTRAAAGALDASIALIDRSSTVLAVAAGSPGEEEKLVGMKAGVVGVELRVADAVVGELRYRPRGEAGGPATSLRMIATLLALEVERARAPAWASDEAVSMFVADLLGREIDGSEEIVARAADLGTDLTSGGGVVILRATPHAAQTGDWSARLLTLTLRAVRSGGTRAIAAPIGTESGEIAAVIPTADQEVLERAASAIEEELGTSMAGFSLAIGISRRADGPGELFRAGKEALMATNVGEAEGIVPLAFDDTGAYRLLLPAMSEDPAELERFFDETIAPLAAYDDQYETELVATVEAYLDNNGNVTPTAETLFTHRHTVRYRLERVRELSGHDLSSTGGREKLGLGLKAMRVLGIPAPAGPAMEARLKSRRAENADDS